ncbi:hypothetical protein FB45DRAFT_945154 [Roridomyces roridus]|uniref:F-box domain-containing protein n=1 Tax=Roridomyces roridus TaxID=1738132 RepID=A0AAD7F8M0_9AGAR|nr:hypothetical protein FB45DRAFT_945154 [Roridomyces roridus]
MESRCPTCGASTNSGSETLDLSVTAEPRTIARYLQLMDTNEPPAAAELAYTRAVVSNTAAQLAGLDQEIARLKTRLMQLEEERSVLAISHQRSIPIISTLRRMPSEILSEIFLLAQPSPVEPAGLPSKESPHFPWRFSHVSRRWREIALSTPSLWSLVYVSSRRKVDPLAMIQAQVQRARSLKIHFYASDTQDSTAQIRLFEFLSEHSVRWEEFVVRLIAGLVPLMAKLRGRLPSLRRLSIQWHNAESQIGVDSLKCFETASSLEDVALHSNIGYIPIPFPAHQLTSYRVEGPFELHQRVLKMASNIIEAKVIIACDPEDSWPDSSDQVIDMPRLRRLHVSSAEVLDYLRAPVLAEIVTSQDDDESPLDRLDAFFQRSSCTPRRLGLAGSPTANTTQEILRKYPFINALGFIFSNTGVEVADAQLEMLGNAPLVSPQLTEIFFGSLVSNPLDFPLFLRMVQSRRGPESALETAAFLSLQGQHPDLVTRNALDELREAGMNIVTGSHRSYIRRWTYDSPWVF